MCMQFLLIKLQFYNKQRQKIIEKSPNKSKNSITRKAISRCSNFQFEKLKLEGLFINYVVVGTIRIKIYHNRLFT